MASQGPLEVFPGIDQPIKSHILRAVTDDVVQSRTVIYTVVSRPKRGQLRVKYASDPVDVTSFTQHEVNAGTIIYRPLSNATDFPWTGVADSIVLEVSTAYATSLRDVTLPVNISYANLNADNVHALITLDPLRVVHEGEAQRVTRDHINASSMLHRLALIGVEEIVYILLKAPQHGRLSVGSGNNATSGYQLSQRDINSGDIMYVHDGSDTTEDYFRLNVELKAAGNEVVGINHVITVNITIPPINDEPFELKTQSPDLVVLQVTENYYYMYY